MLRVLSLTQKTSSISDHTNVLLEQHVIKTLLNFTDHPPSKGLIHVSAVKITVETISGVQALLLYYFKYINVFESPFGQPWFRWLEYVL